MNNVKQRKICKNFSSKRDDGCCEGCQNRMIVLRWIFGAEEAGTVGNRWNKSDPELISALPSEERLNRLKVGTAKNQKSEKLKIKENTEKSEIQKYNNRN